MTWSWIEKYLLQGFPGAVLPNDHTLRNPTCPNPSSPSPGDQMSEVKGSQGWAPCRGSRGGSCPPLPASGGSRRPSLGWWPPPSRLCLRFHVASPLRPCLSSSVFYEDPVLGLRATPTQEDLMSDPSVHHICRDLRFHSEAPGFRRIFANKRSPPFTWDSQWLEVQEVRVLDRW